MKARALPPLSKAIRSSLIREANASVSCCHARPKTVPKTLGPPRAGPNQI